MGWSKSDPYGISSFHIISYFNHVVIRSLVYLMIISYGHTATTVNNLLFITKKTFIRTYYTVYTYKNKTNSGYSVNPYLIIKHFGNKYYCK